MENEGLTRPSNIWSPLSGSEELPHTPRTTTLTPCRTPHLFTRLETPSTLLTLTEVERRELEEDGVY